MSYYQKAERAGDAGYDEQYDLHNTSYRDDPNAYNSAGSGGGNGAGYPYSNNANASASSPYAYQPEKKPWYKRKLALIGLPLLLLIIIVGAVVGGVVGSRSGKNNDSSSSSSNNGGSATTGKAVASTNSAGAGVGGTATGAAGQAYLAVSTDSYMLPVYPTGTATSGYAAPTTVTAAAVAWPSDPSPPSTSSPRAHPRLIAPDYKWQALRSGLIANDPYLKQWNATIIGNASRTLNDPAPTYDIDGGLSGSGVLDVAREIKVKIKNWAYAFHMTNDTRYADRVLYYLTTAAGQNSDVSFGNGTTRWNPDHFLDLAEFSSAFAIAYDWLYDHWTADERTTIRGWIVEYGLNFGLAALSGQSSASDYNWWANLGGGTPVAGNWNCVINGGLTMAALAILGDDTTNTASQVLGLTVPNAKANCFLGVRDDGTWAETSDYWYFGTTGAAEMVSSLITAYGSDQGILEGAGQWNLTSIFHIYNQGMTSKFNWGDNGPNKYSATANSLFLWADQFSQPRYALYQRDHYDASEPWSMFWYNPASSGAWWDGLPLDNHFDDPRDDWASMRSTWTNNDGLFVAMRSGLLTGHQTHGDLDIGDFVIDALGQRWAGEYGSGQYLSTGYFSNENQNSDRWTYFRKRTEGQNTLMLNHANQLVTANTTTNYGSTGEAQGAAPGYSVPSGSTAFYTTDMSSAYSQGTFRRGIRFVNSRKQVLLQDDVSGVNSDVQWRVQTNATVSLDSAGTTATLSLGGETLAAKILSPSSGVKFETLSPTRLTTDPSEPAVYTWNGNSYPGDPSNDGVTVLAITIQNTSNFSLQVVFNPSYGSGTSSITPPSVPVAEWTTTSHNN